MTEGQSLSESSHESQGGALTAATLEPPTMTGLPRHSGWSSCSTLAKNASRSRSPTARPFQATSSGASVSSAGCPPACVSRRAPTPVMPRP